MSFQRRPDIFSVLNLLSSKRDNEVNTALAWVARCVPVLAKNGDAVERRSSMESVLIPNDPPLIRGNLGSRLIPRGVMINFMKNPSLCEQSRLRRTSSVVFQHHYFVPLVKLLRQSAKSASVTSVSLEEVGGNSHSCRKLFIVDWDDTLNPSTWCVQRGVMIIRQPSDVERGVLRLLASKCVETIKLLMKHGHVVIVTNAEEGWVQSSAKSLMPAVSEYVICAPPLILPN